MTTEKGPAPMDEQIELDPERRREILDLEARIPTASLFEVLGVRAGAPAAEVGAAFRDLSRRFHPDRYFGKKLGSFGPRLDKVFRRLVEANQTLCDEARRRAYLEANPLVRAAARAAGDGEPEVPVRGPKTEGERARDDERRARLARHPYLMAANKLQVHINRAKEAMAKQEYSQAFTHLNLAAQADAQNAEVKAMLADVRRLNDAQRAESGYKHGLDALERQDEGLALQAFKSAASAGHAGAAFKAAKLLERAPGDGREAVSFAQKAVDAAPTNAEYRLFLAALLDRAGMKALAKKHLDEGRRLEAEDPDVKKQVKKRWPF